MNPLFLVVLAAMGYGGYEYIIKGKPKKTSALSPSVIPQQIAVTPTAKPAVKPVTAPTTDKPNVAPHLTSVPTKNVPASGNSVPGSVTVPAATNAAVVMNTALASHGYKKSDTNLYKAFQTSVNLKADGLPGPNTMNALQTALAALGVTMAPVHIYPFSNIDGISGPSSAEWNGVALPNKATTPITSSGNIPVVHPNVVDNAVATAVANTVATVNAVVSAIPSGVVDLDYQASGPTQSGGTLS